MEGDITFINYQYHLMSIPSDFFSDTHLFLGHYGQGLLYHMEGQVFSIIICLVRQSINNLCGKKKYLNGNIQCL